MWPLLSIALLSQDYVRSGVVKARVMIMWTIPRSRATLSYLMITTSKNNTKRSVRDRTNVTHLFCSWRCVKEDYLHHFSLPWLDLLAWVLIMKLMPTYYQKLDVILNNIGRFCKLPAWRKDFKREWEKATKKPITMPLNKRYWPNVKRFVCTCLHFVVSRFLLCKHLVQQFHLVEPQFFLQVTWNWCLPFWSHPSIKLLAAANDVTELEQLGATEADDGDGDAFNWANTAGYDIEDPGIESEDDNGLIDTEGQGSEVDKVMFKEKMEDYICIIWGFCNSLEYQVKFQDPQFLKTLEKDGAGFFRLVQNCLSCERWHNSSQKVSPSTWERTTSNAMFYHMCPSCNHGTWSSL